MAREKILNDLRGNLLERKKENFIREEKEYLNTAIREAVYAYKSVSLFGDIKEKFSIQYEDRKYYLVFRIFKDERFGS